MREKISELRCVECGKPCGQKTFNRDLPFRGYFICSECYNLEINLNNNDEDNLFKNKILVKKENLLPNEIERVKSLDWMGFQTKDEIILKGLKKIYNETIEEGIETTNESRRKLKEAWLQLRVLIEYLDDIKNLKEKEIHNKINGGNHFHQKPKKRLKRL